MDLAILYVTCRDGLEAKAIAKALLEKKLVACANMLPVESMYFWQGKPNNDHEVVLLLKTKEGKVNDTVTEIKKLHSYDIPCILRFSAAPNPKYSKWVDEQIK